MFDISQIYKIEEFYSIEERKVFDLFYSHYVWEPSGYSHNENSNIFWQMNMWNHPNFGSCEDLEKLNRVKIELAFDIKLTTERMYLNGQSHGQCGQLHTDLLNIPEEENNEYLTLVYYANENWHPEWGGYTVVVDKNNDIQIFYPKPNSAIIFNSRFPHVGLEPTINFKGLRITMAHKFKITEKP